MLCNIKSVEASLQRQGRVCRRRLKALWNTWKIPSAITVGVVSAVSLLPWAGPWYPFSSAACGAFLPSVASALAAVLALLFAVVLIAFELLRRLLPRYAHKQVFGNPSLRMLASLYIWALLLALCCTLLIEDTPTIVLHNLTLLVGAYTLACFLLLFPLTINVIRSAQVSNSICQIADTVVPSQVDGVTAEEFRRVRATDHFEAQEEEPLRQLSEAASRALADESPLVAQNILFAVTQRLLSLLDANALEARHSIDYFMPLYRRVLSQAIKVEHDETAVSVMHSFEVLLVWAAERQLPWHHLSPLNGTLAEAMEMLLRSGLQRAREQGQVLLYRVAICFWQNAHRLEDPWKAGPEESNQWTSLSDEHMQMLHRSGEIALEIGASGAADRAARQLEYLLDELPTLTNLSHKQVSGVLSWLCCYLDDLAVRMAQRWPDPSSAYFPYNSFTIEHCLKSQTPHRTFLLVRSCQLAVMLLKAGCKSWFHLNELGTIGRVLSRSAVQDPLSRQAVSYVVGAFNELRRIMDDNWHPGYERLYVETHEQLVSIYSWLLDHSEPGELGKLKRQVALTTSSFLHLPEIARRQYKEQQLIWPDGDEQETAT